MIDRVQLAIIILTSLWKITLWKSHLQAYLALAKDRVGKLRKKEKNYSQVDVAKNVTVIWYVEYITRMHVNGQVNKYELQVLFLGGCPSISTAISTVAVS